MGFAYDFDWGVLWRQPYGMWLLQGLWLTIKIGFLGWIIAFFWGICIGTLRVTPWRWLRFFSSAYTEIFRNIPFLVQLFFCAEERIIQRCSGPNGSRTNNNTGF